MHDQSQPSHLWPITLSALLICMRDYRFSILIFINSTADWWKLLTSVRLQNISEYFVDLIAINKREQTCFCRSKRILKPINQIEVILILSSLKQAQIVHLDKFHFFSHFTWNKFAWFIIRNGGRCKNFVNK